ncbi:unnamed protein product, partial [Prorocentrum cordatum]
MVNAEGCARAKQVKLVTEMINRGSQSRYVQETWVPQSDVFVTDAVSSGDGWELLEPVVHSSWRSIARSLRKLFRCSGSAGWQRLYREWRHPRGNLGRRLSWTRVRLGKPDVFTGEEHKWNDWKVIFKDNMKQASQQLCCILLLLCWQHPLTTIVNAGENEGFQAWRKLVEYYEPTARSRIAGQVLNLQNFAFTGDVEDRLALFERELLRYEQISGEAISASMRTGIVFRQLEESPLRQRLLLNATRLVEWPDFRRDLTEICRAQSAIAPVLVPMDLSAFTRGDGKGKSRGGGKGKSKAGGKGKSKGDSKGKSKSDGKGRTGSKAHGQQLGPLCWGCGGRGRARRDCPSKSRGAVASMEQTLARIDASQLMSTTTQSDSYPFANLHSLIIDDPEPDKADGVHSAIGVALVLSMILGNSDAEEDELNGILRVGTDSYAAASVLPRVSCADYLVREGGEAISCKTASGHCVSDEGEKHLVGTMPGASQARAAKFRVADVSKPLLSVAEMVDSGHLLVFDSEGGQDMSYACHRASRDVVKFCRRNKVYEMDVHVDPCAPEVCPVEVAGPEPPRGEAGQSGPAHEEVSEGPRVRPARGPAAPTEAERRAVHEVLHEPYRAWCRECVSGRGLSAGHQTKDRQESAFAVVGIDNGYLGDLEDASPLLIGKGPKQRWFHASTVPSKGAQRPWPAKSWSKRQASAGHKRFVFRSDGEAPLVALKTRVGAKLEEEHGVVAVPEESAVGDSQGNGLAEHAVGDLHGVSVGIERPVTPWMVEFAAMSINLGRRGAGGRTAWVLRRGRPFNGDLACFSEKDELLAGLYLGPALRTGEVYIGTELGVLRARAFKRLAIDQRAEKDLLNSLVGKPWAPVPTDVAIDEVPVAIEIRAPVLVQVAPAGDPLAPVPEAEDLLPRAPRVGRPSTGPRAVYIRKDVEIAKYGITPGCYGCAAILGGARAQAHVAECRARIEQVMQDDDEAKQRLEDARERERHRVDVAGLVRPEGGSSGSGGPAPAQQVQPAAEAAAAADVAMAPALRDPGDDDMQEEVGALLLSLGCSGRKADVMEVICPNRLVGFAPLFGLVHGGSFDLRVGWGLTDRQQQRRCRELIEHCEVHFILGSPRCAPFSMLKYLIKGAEMQREVCAIECENLDLDIVKNVMAVPGVEVGRCDQCVFGLVVADARGDRLAKKPTGWMSNNKGVLEEVCKRCPNDAGVGIGHEHSTFVGRNMRVAERHRVKLLRAILRGLHRHLGNKKVLALAALDGGPNVDDEEISLEDFVGGWRDTLKTEFYDDLAGLPLDPALVKAARRLEMDFMAQLDVWVYAKDEDCYRELGRKPLSVRWVDIDKGDADRPDCRSRIVVQETKAQSTIAGDDIGAVFAPTPPLGCLRLISSMVMSSDPSEGRVHPMSQEVGACGLLRVALYGARDAGQNFELATAGAVVGAGCDQSAFSPCVCCREDLQVSFFRRGGDFVLEGSRGGAESIRETLKTKFIVMDWGVLGPEPTDSKEIARLSRVVRRRDRWGQGGEAIECEACPRHAQILHAQLGMDPHATKSLSTPGVGQKLTPEVEQELNEHEAAECRSACMRLGYLALDRPEVQFAAKECARGMQNPKERHFRLLKRAGRLLIRGRRAIWGWGRQRTPAVLDIYSDTDWAGCPITRRSASSVVVEHGQHLIVAASTTRISMSMSSGEAEFDGCMRAAGRAIGMQSLCQGLGREAGLRIWSDSAAALGIMQRRGCGKVRRLETPTLWVQKALKDGRFQLAKVSGKANLADLGAKILHQAAMLRALKMMNVELSDAPLANSLQAGVAGSSTPALLLCTRLGASGQSPIGKVIELLSSLEAQIQKEGEESAKLNSEKEGWCKDTAVNLGFEIKTGSGKVEELKAAIGKEAATVSSLASRVEDLVATIAKDDKDLAAATKIRNAESSDFVAEEHELTDTISALQRAIDILQREMSKSGGAAFVQVKSAASVIQALQALVKASAFSAADANTLTSFVQSRQEAEDNDEEPGAPEAATYKSKSGSIVDVLEDLLDKANEQLDAARKKETSARHNFEMLAQSLKDEIKFSTKDMDEAKKSSASSSEAKSEAEGALAATSKDLAGDKAALEELKKDCATHADDYAAEVKSRAEELKAVQDRA